MLTISAAVIPVAVRRAQKRPYLPAMVAVRHSHRPLLHPPSLPCFTDVVLMSLQPCVWSMWLP